MKRSKRANITVSALIVMSLLISAPVSAHLGFRPGRLGLMRVPLLAELQLTGDQQAQLQSIFATSREAIRALHQQLREKQTALREAARTEPFDQALVRSQAQEMAGVQAELLVARTELINSVLGVLTDEQKARLNELREQRLQQFREWRKQHMSKPDQLQQN